MLGQAAYIALEAFTVTRVGTLSEIVDADDTELPDFCEGANL